MLNSKVGTMREAYQAIRQSDRGVLLNRILGSMLIGALLAYLFLTSSGQEKVVKPVVKMSVEHPVVGVFIATFVTLWVVALINEGFKLLLASFAYMVGFYAFLKGGKLVLDDAILGGWFYHWLVLSMCLVALLAQHQSRQSPQRLFG